MLASSWMAIDKLAYRKGQEVLLALAPHLHQELKAQVPVWQQNAPSSAQPTALVLLERGEQMSESVLAIEVRGKLQNTSVVGKIFHKQRHVVSFSSTWLCFCKDRELLSATT